MRLKIEKSSHIIAEGRNKSLLKELALMQSALKKEKARSDQLSQSLFKSSQHFFNWFLWFVV